MDSCGIFEAIELHSRLHPADLSYQVQVRERELELNSCTAHVQHLELENPSHRYETKIPKILGYKVQL